MAEHAGVKHLLAHDHGRTAFGRGHSAAAEQCDGMPNVITDVRIWTLKHALTEALAPIVGRVEQPGLLLAASRKAQTCAVTAQQLVDFHR